jgi:dihydrodipicolinate synthase/N-acetylneuraminate lyase
MPPAAMPTAHTELDAAALAGVTCVLVTPFRDRVGAPDAAALERLVRHVDGAGVQAITALGNTAEVFQLSAPERRTVLEAGGGGAGGGGVVFSLPHTRTPIVSFVF